MCVNLSSSYRSINTHTCLYTPTHTHTVAPLRAVAIEPPAAKTADKNAKPDWEVEYRRKK